MKGQSLRHSAIAQAKQVPSRPLISSSAARLGNQAHLRRLQAKLTVGSVNDPLEREADQAADAVMRSAAPPTLQRKCAGCEDEDKTAQREAGGGGGDRAAGAEAPAAVHETLAAPGAPLDMATGAFMSERMGQDFSAVRVHTDSRAAASARAVDAHAYTVGADLVFGAGQYQPGTAAGQRLIAHELAHVVQQGASSPGPRAPVLRRDGPTGPDAPLKEAKKEDATGAFEGGVKTIGEQLGKNEAFKNFGLGLAKRYALPVWNGASDADKAALIAGGTVFVGTGLGALLANPEGRKALSGINFLAPLSLVPYATLSGFSFDLPKTKTDPLGLHFSFKADDLIALAHSKLPSIPDMTASLDITMNIGPDGKVTTPSALANIGLAPGVTLAAGYGVVTDLPKLTPTGDGALTPYKDYPQPAQDAPHGGAVVYFGIDLLKAHILPPKLRAALGGSAK
ncbi:MAG TPA: DUF4157 domain-containing protein [Caulobacteraceae bacterium]|jgi:hypothetical protein